MELSAFQKRQKARTIVENTILIGELDALDERLTQLFEIAPPGASEATARTEITELVRAIDAGTASNNQVAKFLELADLFGR